MLHVTWNNKRDFRLKCQLIFNLVFNIITTIEIKHAKKRKAVWCTIIYSENNDDNNNNNNSKKTKQTKALL